MSAVLARRYARAFFDLAVRQKATARWREELDRLLAAGRVCPELLPALADDRIPFLRRERLMDEIAEQLGLSPLSRNFCKVLIAKRRIHLLSEIVEAYVQLVSELEGVVTAEITTAVPLSDAAILQAIESVVARVKRRKVVLSARSNPTLIGGVVIRIGDEIYDGSVTAELRRVRERLLYNQ